MSGEYTITVPEADTNLITNPSFEINTTGWSAATDGDGAIVRSLTKARHGTASLKLTGSTGTQTTSRFNYTFSASTTYALSGWIYIETGVGTGTISLLTNSGIGSVTIDKTITGRWQYVSLIGTTGAGGAGYIDFPRVDNYSQAFVIYTDSVDLIVADHVVTHIDGDQPGCKWTGVAHGSTSTRDAQYRGGGRERVIDAVYGVYVDQNGTTGQGVAPLENMTQEYALQPGSEFQEVKVHPRVLTLKCKIPSSSLADLHSKRKAFWDVIKPDLCAPTQPFVLGYTETQASKTVYGSFYYESGMEVTGDELAMLDSFDLRLIGTDPYWYENNQDQTTLTQQTAVASNQAMARINGTWGVLGTGVDDYVYCIAVDYAHNRIYYGGKFVNANGVVVNGIFFWDGVTAQPLGLSAGTKGIGVAGTGIVYSIAIAPNGDVWAAGNFTTAGGSATKGLARWAYPCTNNAPTVFATSTTFSLINSIVIDNNYRIYIGGTFTGFNGTANCSYFTYSSDQGTTWVAPTATVASGGTPVVYSMALDIDGLGVYVGGDFTAIAGVASTNRIFKYSGGVFTALSTGLAADVHALGIKPDGTLLIGKAASTYFITWNGSVFTNITSMPGATPYSFAVDASGGVTYLGLNSNNNLYFFNGSTVSVFDVSFTGTPDVTALALDAYKNIYLGWGAGGGASKSSGITTVTVTSTVATYPMIVIGATTTAASQTTLNFIENQTTKQRLYINSLALNTGEVLTIDCRPGMTRMSSNWRGDLTSYILNNSDRDTFRLLSGANTIALYLSGTVTGATAVIQNVPQHLSVDGGAA